MKFPFKKTTGGDPLSVYFAGDTGIFGDMELIEMLHKPQFVMLPIGGYTTMNSENAA